MNSAKSNFAGQNLTARTIKEDQASIVPLPNGQVFCSSGWVRGIPQRMSNCSPIWPLAPVQRQIGTHSVSLLTPQLLPEFLASVQDANARRIAQRQQAAGTSVPPLATKPRDAPLRTLKQSEP